MKRNVLLVVWLALLWARPVAAAVAFDAVSTSLRTGTTDPHTFTHTPVGTPRGVFCGASHGVTATSHMVSATYGGVSMSMIKRQTDTAGEPGVAEIWFLGASLPTGAQTVSFDLDSATADDIQFSCVTVTAGADTEVPAAQTCTNPQDNNEANPTCTATFASKTRLVFGAYYTGAGGPGTCAGDATTSVASADHGNWSSVHCRSAAVTAANAVCTHTVAADDQALTCAAVNEIAGGGAPTPKLLTVMGIGQ